MMKNILLGTDWWTDCDDAVAVRLLARAHKTREIKLIGIGINACMEHSVPSLGAFLRAEGVEDEIPLGIDLAGDDFGGRLTYQYNLAKHPTKYRSNEDVENAVHLYRRLLAESDEPVEIIEIGFLQVFADLLESQPDELSDKTGIELVKEKVAKVWVMAGKWDEDGGKENNFERNARSRKGGSIFCEKCPVPVTFLGWEIGIKVVTGGELPDSDFLKQVLNDHGSVNGRYSWDPMTVMLTLIGDEEAAGYRVVQGTASVDSETGENHFVPSSKGLHKYVIMDREPVFYQNQINEKIR